MAAVQDFRVKNKSPAPGFLGTGLLKKLLIAEFFQKFVNLLGRREHMVDGTLWFMESIMLARNLVMSAS